jgi:hypothetical protein
VLHTRTRHDKSLTRIFSHRLFDRRAAGRDARSAHRCAAACCAHPNSNPFATDGCVAWSLNGWNQCFLCNAHANLTAVPQDAKCSGPPPRTTCSTGLVTPAAPPPPPPAPLTGKLGGEGSVQYVDYGRSARWPSYPNGTAFPRSLLTPEGWPMADCTMVIFDARPTGAWAPPIDDPEQRQVS